MLKDQSKQESRKRVLNISEMKDGEVKGVEVDGVPVLLIRYKGKIYAYEDRCSHQDMPISENYEIEGEKIICMWHGAEFDITSGKNLSMPAPSPIKKLSVYVDSKGDVFVEVP